MGLYLRKSVRVGPFRFNLSQSGIGVSTGTRRTLRGGSVLQRHRLNGAHSAVPCRACVRPGADDQKHRPGEGQASLATKSASVCPLTHLLASRSLEMTAHVRTPL
ncbi:TPA: DUF4236 domain-containing protein [Pseudomonas aeruginosa]|nr:DUF4236 domain-containing protein [Pseudomonas aeruginosa]